MSYAINNIYKVRKSPDDNTLIQKIVVSFTCNVYGEVERKMLLFVDIDGDETNEQLTIKCQTKADTKLANLYP